jgi:hypothetical protein
MKTSLKFFANALIVSITLCGCGKDSNVENGKIITTINRVTIETYIVDNCEYIGNVRGFTRDFLAHKGNCKFCAERNKKNCQ